MSCLMMDSKPLAALANAVEARLNYDYNYWGFEAPDSLFLELEDCKSSCTYHAGPIYRRLYALNARAYDGRYKDHEGPAGREAPDVDVSRYVVHRGPEYRENGFAVRPWHYRLARILDCWLYQTAESGTWDDPLRLAMEEFRDGLFRFVVTNHPEFVDLRWEGGP